MVGLNSIKWKSQIAIILRYSLHTIQSTYFRQKPLLLLSLFVPILAEFMTDLSQSHYEALKRLSFALSAAASNETLNRRYYSPSEVS